MGKTTDQPICLVTEPHADGVINVLREHLDDCDAKMLARRLQTFDQDAKTAWDWKDVSAPGDRQGVKGESP